MFFAAGTRPLADLGPLSAVSAAFPTSALFSALASYDGLRR
ncbi:hypothetical protein SAMN04489712_111167 [Thermomonospora echinospora]|uniref:Uncharacterized protein n=1 Tax=Thermomonospora echinospora TaxID=1992 RepID=A0A1H6CVM8_9ACTN|nr:hypothetical protein [Thermomonospora echinospora]SEG76466.1 hypothetical protein SAMN04489712_111167 [Thermomonospora echinospora]